MPHTPAPWTIQEYGDDECPTLVLHKGETENRICFMATPGSHGDPAVIEADAHLIAAAPYMLDALREIDAMAKNDEARGDDLLWTTEWQGAVEKARAAIAKTEA